VSSISVTASGWQEKRSRLPAAATLAITGLCLVSGSCAPSPAPAYRPSGTREEQQGFEALLQRVRGESGVPALAAAFVRGSELVAAAAVGVRRIDRGDPVTLDDRFHIGSVSKPLSATVIATLVEDHVLRWETTVAEVFPELAGQVNPVYLGVTLENLLSHRAGIVPWEEDEEISRAPAVTGTPRQQRRAVIPWILNQPPVAPPGTEHLYSNAGYLIAAAMAEQAAGAAWEDLVQERLGRPLALTSLGFGWPVLVDPAEPWGHRSSPNGFVPHDPSDGYQAGPWLAPAGDLHMNMVDLARCAQLHLEGLQGKATLLSSETFQKLHRPIGDYALGWNIKETADHHLGGLGTFHAAIWVSRPRNAALVVATNADADAAIFSEVINGSLRLFNVPKP
jgi:CubicO group peptidase (beta-lactamase class C family)